MYIPPYLKYAATLPVESQKFKFVTSCTPDRRFSRSVMASVDISKLNLMDLIFVHLGM